MRFGLVLPVLALFFVNSVMAGISGNTFTDPKSGLSISKPAGWEFVKTLKAHGLQLKDGTMTGAQNKTLVAFTKDMGKSFSGVKPTVGVERLNLPKKADPVEWLTEELKRQEEHDKYYVPGSSPMPTVIDGAKGGRAAYVNSTVIEGKQTLVYHVLYVVPSGGEFLLIHMNCNDELTKDYIDAFAKIAGTITVKQGR